MAQIVNITPEVMEAMANGNSTGTKTNFNAKNYLNTQLEDGEESRKITIRLLPMDLKTGNPFLKIKTHKVIVPEEISKKGNKYGKYYFCLAKNDEIDHEKFGTKCPFCELNKKAYEAQLKETDPIKKEELKKISLANKERDSVIVRCIERGHESDGVKFWKFNIRQDCTDPYNSIMNLYKERKIAGERKGKVVNILDLYHGKDLIVTISEGNAAPTIIDDDEYTPLSPDEAQIEAWVNDPKKWSDVFGIKPYDYLKLISQMRVPWYDRQSGKWIAKDDYENSKKSSEEAMNDADEAVSKEAPKEEPKESVKVEEKPSVISSIQLDDDLPF